MRKILIENEFNVLIHITGKTKFFGCQCFGDCNCGEDFKSQPINFYQVKRKLKKTTNHSTLCEALARWNFVNTLN